MRVECSACKRLAEGRFAMAADGEVMFRCDSCGVTTRSPVAARAAPSTTIPIDKLCPKCASPRQPDAAACKVCGISNERMAAYIEERDAAIPEAVRAEWLGVELAWKEPSRHDAFLATVTRHNCYAWAAGRYRDAARSRPHDPIAAKHLERVRKAGEAALFASATVRPEKAPIPYTAVIAVLGVLLIAIVGGVMYAASKRGESHPEPPPPSAPIHTQVR